MSHQEVELIAVTQPQIPVIESHTLPDDVVVPIERPMTADEFIAYTARVSNPDNQNNTQTAPKLIGYLINNEHWSPFEMVSVCQKIVTTRDIGRQILRHRSFSFQEFSQRYAAAQNFVTREARLQDKKNRQNSIETDDESLEQWWENMQSHVRLHAQTLYEEALANGIAKEQARVVLPEGMTQTTMYMSGTLRSWIHYCQLRMYHGTQKEHTEIATLAWENICKQFPSIAAYYAEKKSAEEAAAWAGNGRG